MFDFSLNFKGFELFQYFLKTGLVGKLVLLTLFFISVQSWVYIIWNLFHFRNLGRILEELEELAINKKSFNSFVKAIRELEENLIVWKIKKVVVRVHEMYEEFFEKSRREEGEEVDREVILEELKDLIYLEKQDVMRDVGRGLGFLATAGSVSPYIGLFGTVWGIIKAFNAIGQAGSVSLATVAPGIAEALLNTAMGLFCAIPAVIAYNAFVLRRERFSEGLDILFERIYFICRRVFY